MSAAISFCRKSLKMKMLYIGKYVPDAAADAGPLEMIVPFSCECPRHRSTVGPHSATGVLTWVK